jgi:hypothetical protein
MDTLIFIKGNSYMVFANWALVIATMVLALITFFYMRHTKRLADDTKRMADIMVQEFEIRVTPLLVIKRLPSNTGSTRELHFIVTNRGFLPVHITKIIFEGWPKVSPSRIFRKETNIDKILGQNESSKGGDIFVQLRKGDISILTPEESKDFNMDQFLNLCQGKIYFTYIDIHWNEQQTRDWSLEQL